MRHGWTLPFRCDRNLREWFIQLARNERSRNRTGSSECRLNAAIACIYIQPHNFELRLELFCMLYCSHVPKNKVPGKQSEKSFQKNTGVRALFYENNTGVRASFHKKNTGMTALFHGHNKDTANNEMQCRIGQGGTGTWVSLRKEQRRRFAMTL